MAAVSPAGSGQPLPPFPRVFFLPAVGARLPISFSLLPATCPHQVTERLAQDRVRKVFRDRMAPKALLLHRNQCLSEICTAQCLPLSSEMPEAMSQREAVRLTSSLSCCCCLVLLAELH